MLESVQTMQDRIVEAYDPSAVEENVNRGTDGSRQLSREQNALRSILERHPRSPQHSLKAIHEYTAKTRASLTEEYVVRGGRELPVHIHLSEHFAQRYGERGAH